MLLQVEKKTGFCLGFFCCCCKTKHWFGSYRITDTIVLLGCFENPPFWFIPKYPQFQHVLLVKIQGKLSFRELHCAWCDSGHITATSVSWKVQNHCMTCRHHCNLNKKQAQLLLTDDFIMQITDLLHKEQL